MRPALAPPPLQGAPLLVKVDTLAGKEQVPVHLVSVKIRTINAGELGHAPHRHPADTAHPGAVHHYRVQANDGLDPKRFSGLGAELHHDTRTNGNDQVNLLATFK